MGRNGGILVGVFDDGDDGVVDRSDLTGRRVVFPYLGFRFSSVVAC